MNLVAHENERKPRKKPEKKPVRGSLKDYLDAVS
jgi:hypothetical protein